MLFRSTNKLNKIFGMNVGKGPIWELMEDRSWWKESKSASNSQRDRRPRVYEDLDVSNGWSIIDEQYVVL